jgi:hypothetical protein
MRRPDQLRTQAFFAASAAVGFALFMSFLVFLAFGREGRLGFASFNLAGIVEGIVFLAAFVTALGWERSALRLPSPTLLSFGLLAPPTARRVAERVPLVDASGALQTLADHRVVIVQEAGVSIGVSGIRRERITSWDELVKVAGDVAVTDLRRPLSHEQLVVVVDGDEVLGVVTQEAFLAGLWGRVR